MTFALQRHAVHNSLRGRTGVYMGNKHMLNTAVSLLQAFVLSHHISLVLLCCGSIKECKAFFTNVCLFSN